MSKGGEVIVPSETPASEPPLHPLEEGCGGRRAAQREVYRRQHDVDYLEHQLRQAQERLKDAEAVLEGWNRYVEHLEGIFYEA